ncbi:antibiotic biosynthesis monooxygenase [Fictibacillus nanhaiensis]|uniref:putative quinol monooxygenase n=1 Tax=Fictibacillus nanhaiensis TaxID=742169 RepID=UPI001C943841|nr:putative quinol monooxygenase [Fictibacillus nanhaiensis]MBY6037404.1 antibiotic biosynthesis monooxygenase [Fictibacillus nanhaiensis]
MIIIHAGFEVKKEVEEEFLEEIYKLTDASREESGNLSYDLMKDTEKTNAYLMVEVWKDEEAVQHHNTSEHFTSFIKKANQYLSAPPHITMFEGKQIER